MNLWSGDTPMGSFETYNFKLDLEVGMHAAKQFLHLIPERWVEHGRLQQHLFLSEALREIQKIGQRITRSHS